jgi:hypothetical protein
MPRLANISKYWRSCLSGASASANVYAMLVPSMGDWSTPLTIVGSGSPAASRIVGARSITWVNCERTPPFSSIPAGQWTIVPLRVPPQWEATCFVHWKGEFIAHAQPTE